MELSTAGDLSAVQVVKKGFDLEVTIPRSLDDIISSDRQLASLLGQKPGSHVVQEQLDSCAVAADNAPITHSTSFNHYRLKAGALLQRYLLTHSHKLAAAQLAYEGASRLRDICKDALTAATATAALAAQLGQEEQFADKLAAAQAAYAAANHQLDATTNTYMAYKLWDELGSNVAAVEQAEFDYQQQRYLGIYQKCKHMHHQHLLEEHAQWTGYNNLKGLKKTLARWAQRLDSCCKEVGASMLSDSDSSPEEPAPAKTAPAASPAPARPTAAAPPPAATTEQYLSVLAAMCLERRQKEQKIVQAAHAHRADAYMQLRGWKTAWKTDNPCARIRSIMDMIKYRTVPLNWEQFSTSDIALAVVSSLPWLWRSRQTLMKQDLQEFAYPWATQFGYSSSSASAPKSAKHTAPPPFTAAQKHKWQQLQQISPAAAKRKLLTNTFKFTLAASKPYSELVGGGWLVLPGHKLAASQQSSTAWLSHHGSPPAKVQACLRSLNTPGRDSPVEKSLKKQMLADPTEVQYRQQLRAYSASPYPDLPTVLREEIQSARLVSSRRMQLLEEAIDDDGVDVYAPTGLAVDRSTASEPMLRHGVESSGSSSGPADAQRDAVFVVISRSQLPSHVNNADEADLKIISRKSSKAGSMKNSK